MAERTVGAGPQEGVRRAFQRYAEHYDEFAVLPREVGARLLQRLELIRIEPKVVCDVGAGTGVAARALVQRYPGALVLALDNSTAMLAVAARRAPMLRRWRNVCANAEALPLADGSCDLIFSNLTLEWVPDLERCCHELRRVLAPGGCLMFSTLGPDTLRELRQAWAQRDQYRHVNDLRDMHDIGDALVRAGLAEPVMDMELVTLTFGSFGDLVRELKLQGSSVIGARAPGLNTPSRLAAVRECYQAFRREGRLPATFEVVYGHAWGPASTDPRLALATEGGGAAIGLDKLRRALRLRGSR